MVFIDGSNAYHAFKEAYGSGKYDVQKLGKALSTNRSLIRVNFYTAAVPQQMGKALYANQ